MNSINGKDIGTGGLHLRQMFRVAAFALVVALLLGSCGYVLAKYVDRSDLETAAASAKLYMSSNYLTASSQPTYNVYTGGIRFSLRNSDGIKITEDDIYYTVSVKDGEDDVTAQLTVNDDGGVLIGGTADINTIAVSGLTYGRTYTVSVSVDTTRANAVTYAYTLSAEFAVQSAGESTIYKVDDYGSYVELTVFAGTSRTITICYDGFAPDNADPLMTTWTEAQGEAGNQLAVSANTAYRLIFFGTGMNVTERILVGDTITIT